MIYRLCFTFCALISLPHNGLYAQCQDWSASARLITGSTCAANGSFEVIVSGPDAGNLSNIQYAVPATGSYAVPLNNSPVFTSVPGGTWPVSVVAVCGGNFVGKNTTITMPGDYVPPTARVAVNRNSIHCGAHGRIRVDIIDGRAPFIVNLVNTPAGYTGPFSFNTTGTNFTITDLPVGSYTIQVTDACNSGTAPQSLTVGILNAGSLPLLNDRGFGKNNCDLLIVPKPYVTTTNNGWGGYPDTFYRIAAEIDGGVAPASGFENLSGSFNFPLSPGMTIKDCYGKTVRYTIRPPCGSDFYTTRRVPYPSITYTVDQNCNIDFKAVLKFEGLICFPVTYTISGNGNTYGPFTTADAADTTPSLPIGSYSVNFTTADGYNGGGNFHTNPISGTPYSVELRFTTAGLHNYADGFIFRTTLSSTAPRTIELFSAPPGYTFLETYAWSGTTTYIERNQFPTPATIKFPPGNYVWKITDDCGTYLLPITITADDLYQYTIDIDSMQQTCNGLYVKPKGTITHNGQPVGVTYLLLREDEDAWLGIPAYAGSSNDTFLINTPGSYIIVPYVWPWTELIRGGLYNLIPISFPNIYTKSYSFTYEVHPLQADMDQSQGFICSGTPGQGEIHVRGKDGIPFSGGHYRYRLARAGDGLTGPYIADNTTGVFTGFGGNAGEFYEVKIEDSCGAFVVQPFEILDLRIARLIASSTYVACDSARIQLIALYLPGATYFWTGPNGFTSTQRTPVIEKIGPQHIGVYKVSITIPQCSQPITDTTIITSNIKPVAPEVSLSCLPRPVIMRITNPQPGYDYKWEYTLNLGSWGYSYVEDSDSNYTKGASFGSFRAIAIDTATRCMSYSDSLHFPNDPNIDVNLQIYTARRDLCPGDTTTLLASFSSVIPGHVPPAFQWFFNSVPIPGAVNQTFITDLPGDYKVSMALDSCNNDTSATITIGAIPLPSVSVHASDTVLCNGDTAILQAATGTGYTHTWNHNGSTVPGALSGTLQVTQPGAYYVTVANTGCAVISDTVVIRVYDPPVAHITPATTQRICAGDTIHFSTPPDTAYRYEWSRDGLLLGQDTTNVLTVFAAGKYSVAVSRPACPTEYSDTVQVIVDTLPGVPLRYSSRNACAGDTIVLDTDGGPGYVYEWYRNGAPLPGVHGSAWSATQNGIYYVRVTNGVCVKESDTVSLTFHPQPLVQLSPGSDQRICMGDTVRFSTFYNPSYTYTWKQDGTVIGGAVGNTLETTVAGSYSVTVSAAYCPEVHSDTVRVDAVPPPAASIQVSALDICAGDTIRIYAATGVGYSYTWYRNGTLIPGGSGSSLLPDQSGNYHVVISNGACSRISNTLSVTVHQPPVAQLTPAGHQYLCAGSNMAISTPAGAGYQYTWFRDGVEIIGAQNNQYFVTNEGHYRVRVSAAFCPDDWSDTVSVTILPASLELGKDTVICTPGSFSVPLSVPEGFDSYIWSDGSRGRSVVAGHGGKWWVRAENQCGIFTDTLSIQTAIDYHPGLPADTLVCNETNSLRISVPRILQSLQWSTGATTHDIIVEQPGTYWISGESPCGIITDTIQVRFCAPQIEDIILSDRRICAGECISLSAVTGNHPQSYEWLLPGATPGTSTEVAPARICYDQAGTFPITLGVTNAGGTAARIADIIVLPAPVPRFPDTALTVSYKVDMQLSACADAETADWYTGDSLICASCPVLDLQPILWKQVYYCVVKNGNCADTCTYLVTTKDIPAEVTIPSAFTPNGDGKNDYFRIVTNNPNIIIKEMVVYNRWGNKVYSGNSLQGWDGLHKGKPAEGGAYFWQIRYGLINSEETWTRKGDVMLIR